MSPVKSPQDPEEGKYRVKRGCCWHDSARNCRAAHRDGITPGIRFINLGFRIVLVPRMKKP